MKSTTVELLYNPFTVKSKFIVNRESVTEGPLDSLTSNKRLQQWIDILFKTISETYNTNEIEFLFTGTLLDSEDVKDAVYLYNKDNPAVDVKVKYKVKDEPIGHKVTKLRELYKEAQNGPFDEFKSDEMVFLFEEALAPEFEVSVLATMSSGKSTVINAMLGKELMPAKNEACTATVARIEDHDEMSNFQAARFDAKQDRIDDWQDVDYKLMEKWNDDDKTSLIDIKGDIPAINEREGVRLVLVDTPGPNNSRDSRHGQTVIKAIKDKQLSMVLYILNATQLGTEDDKILLELIRDTMASGGREAQDRFIFIANKIDSFDPENGESVSKALKDIRLYLMHNGIKNPLVIPASAELLKLIRIAEFEGEKSLTRKQRGNLNAFVENFVEVEEMNMLKHVKEYISTNTYKKLHEKLSAAKNNEDDRKQAEILSGIPIAEILLDNFISKHAIPAKLKDAVDSFTSVMTKAEGLEKLNILIQKDSEELDRLVKSIESFNKDKTRIEQAQEFRDKVKKMKYSLSKESTEARKIIDEKTNSLLDKYEDRFRKAVKPSEANWTFTNVERDCGLLFDEIYEILADNLNKELVNKLDGLRNEYQEYVEKVLNDSFPNNDDIAAKDFHKVSMEMPDAKSLINEATYTKETKTFIRTERHGFLWLKKRDVFDTTYEDLVDMSGPYLNLEASIHEAKMKNFKEFGKVANANFEAAKEVLLSKMDEIDNKMNLLFDDIQNASQNKEQKEKMIAENRKKLEWYETFETKLNSILAV